MSSYDSQWFAIQTKTCGERLAQASLAQLGLETLLPLTRRAPAGWRARRNPVKALFPGYLFARFCAELNLRVVMYAHGVVRVVSAGEQPLAVEVPIIDSLRARMDASDCVKLEAQPFTRGEPVSIKAGPFAGWRGVFDKSLSDAQRLVIFMDAVHRGRLVVRADWVERCAAT
jgi:transcriptional antiterminator RfaH